MVTLSEQERALRDLDCALARVKSLLRERQSRRVLIAAPEPLSSHAARIAAACGYQPAIVASLAEAAATAAGAPFELILAAAEPTAALLAAKATRPAQAIWRRGHRSAERSG